MRVTSRPPPLTPPHKGEGNMPGECATLRRSLSNHPTRRTPWRKARCAATRKRRSQSRTRTNRKAPLLRRRSPACTARRTRTRTARSLKPARRAATNTLPCRGRVDARSASGWGCLWWALIRAAGGLLLWLAGFAFGKPAHGFEIATPQLRQISRSHTPYSDTLTAAKTY